MPAMPKQYSVELVSLIKSMLNHNPDRRPSVNRILREPYIKQHIAEFLDNTKKHQLNKYVNIIFGLSVLTYFSMSVVCLLFRLIIYVEGHSFLILTFLLFES